MSDQLRGVYPLPRLAGVSCWLSHWRIGLPLLEMLDSSRDREFWGCAARPKRGAKGMRREIIVCAHTSLSLKTRDLHWRELSRPCSSPVITYRAVCCATRPHIHQFGILVPRMTENISFECIQNDSLWTMFVFGLICVFKLRYECIKHKYLPFRIQMSSIAKNYR